MSQKNVFVVEGLTPVELTAPLIGGTNYLELVYDTWS